jgi:hypothetical protein
METLLLLFAALLLIIYAYALLRCYNTWAVSPSYSMGSSSSAPAPFLAIPAATPVSNSSGNVANAMATATLPAVSNKTTYIEGFDITGTGATAASVITATVTGLPASIGTFSFDVTIPAGVTTAIGTNGTIPIRFPTPLPASAANVSPVVTVPAFGGW